MALPLKKFSAFAETSNSRFLGVQETYPLRGNTQHVTAQQLPMYATLLGCDAVTPSAHWRARALSNMSLAVLEERVPVEARTIIAASRIVSSSPHAASLSNLRINPAHQNRQ